jgi:spore coat polysaccharide biosynthesis predicted glycosyltransferase SpsG
MGGSDKLQFTEKIIESFKKTDYKIKIDIVLGSFFKDSEKIRKLIGEDKRFKIIQNNENLLMEMKKSTIGIFTFGLTTYESLFAGLPSIIISHSKLNDKYGKMLNSYECINYLGYYKNVEFGKIASLAEKLMLDKKIREKYIQKGEKIVDGKGIQRIVQRIINLMDGKVSEVL